MIGKRVVGAYFSPTRTTRKTVCHIAGAIGERIGIPAETADFTQSRQRARTGLSGSGCGGVWCSGLCRTCAHRRNIISPGPEKGISLTFERCEGHRQQSGIDGISDQHLRNTVITVHG